MFRLRELPCPFKQAVNVGGLRLRGLVRPQHAVHEGPEPVRLLNNDLGVLAEFRGTHRPIEELGGAANAAKGVLDFMSQTANQLSSGFLNPLLLCFPVNAKGAIYREQLEQKRWGFAVAEGRHREVHGEALMLRSGD